MAEIIQSALPAAETAAMRVTSCLASLLISTDDMVLASLDRLGTKHVV